MSSVERDEPRSTPPVPVIPVVEPLSVDALDAGDTGEGIDAPDADGMGEGIDARDADGMDDATPATNATDEPRPADPLSYEMPGRKLAAAPYVLEGSTGRHFVFPLALIVAGTLMLYASLMREAGSGEEFARAAMHRSLYLTVVVLLTLGVAATCARVLDVTFGLVTPAVVKLTALVVFPMAVGAVIGPYFSSPGAAADGAEAEAMGMLFGLPLMWLLFFVLFRIEAKEAVICVAALTTLRMFAAIEYAYR